MVKIKACPNDAVTKPNKFQPNSKEEGMFGNLLPKAIYPDKVNYHLSLHQASMVTSLGPGGEVKSLIPTEHFPFPGNFSFLADFVTEGFKHFHTKCQKQHQLM